MNIDKTLSNLHIQNKDYIIVGVSSGPDSMCLIDLLQKEKKYNIVCAHINHNVRKQSKKEEKFLENYCKEKEIIFETMLIKEYKDNNFENEARKKRYNFYEELITKYNSKYLFLAHHGDDLIETVIMKIMRGSNLEGYAGIKEISSKQGYEIVRPLIYFTKEDIIEYNKKNKIKYYIDKSNKDTNYTRNRYRKYILPILKKENSLAHNNFIRYSKILLEYDDYIKNEINLLIKKEFNNNKLSINNIKEYPLFIQKNLLFCILNGLYDNKSDIVKEKHVLSIIDLIYNSKPNCVIDLPNNIKAIKEYKTLNFKISNQLNENYRKKLQKKNLIFNHHIDIINESNSDGNDICRLNSKELSLPLYIRNKKNGDTMYVKNLGNKKIKDIFIDKKITTKVRNSYPLLVDKNDNILWIPNLKKSQFNKKMNENYDIILKYYQKEENK